MVDGGGWWLVAGWLDGGGLWMVVVGGAVQWLSAMIFGPFIVHFSALHRSLHSRFFFLGVFVA